MKDDTISRAAALDALGERPVVWSDNDDYTLGERNQYDMDRLAIETVPSVSFENHDEIKSYSKDTISRSAAVEAMRKAKDKSELHRMLVQLPSAQPGWIPCSERLPERYDNYIITTENGMVVFGVYDPREKQWCRYDKIKSCWLYGIKVLAWQPTPNPWEGNEK